ncbi:hypothetical protein [Paenibacillus sp. JDR-2]|uniref:hypothetical protein n=1 Tax=Paenibacillus sp. (strain JDR-2) TaxID=324057 RepID=UPI0001666611|nr:hypothetical protein [Paenibacillus sp. JDR-2]ACS99807.1 hypothetical protein Pjdr2_1129 [Paenibacillus sp. JDR-2]
MGLFDWIRESITGQKICPPEHLESYKRLGEQVYGLHVELVNSEMPRALAFLQATRSMQMMADALLGDALLSESISVPIITHNQADIWYGKIPDLMVATRQEAVFANAASIALPIQLGQQEEGPSPCPVEHLAGLRRSAEVMDEMTAQAVELIRDQGEKFKEVILLYASAKTRKQAGDAIVGNISNGRKVSAESHEDAEEQYWMALSDYLLVAQGLKVPDLVKRSNTGSSSHFFVNARCKLDSSDIWKVTSAEARNDIIESGEWAQAVADLEEHWSACIITPLEREYETTAEELIKQGLIKEDGYWYCCPFPPVYRVTGDSVHVLGRVLPRGHVFVYEYGDDGASGNFITAASFQSGVDRKYCEDD